MSKKGGIHYRPLCGSPFLELGCFRIRLAPIRSPSTKLNGVLSRMNRGTSEERALLRQAFDLLLELRTRPDARKLLGQAVNYLRLLEHQGASGGLPLVISMQVMRLRKL